jgi:hypothetical protein
MSRYGMPIHKFITKRNPPIRVRTRPDSIFWRPKEVTYGPIRQGLRWEIFAQRPITIQPKTSMTLELGFGVRMTKGKCLVSLRQKLIEKELLLQDGTVSEDVEDIIITIQNNSDTAVIIKERDSLCYINYYLN